MDARPTARQEIGALTGARFAAACLVLISHTTYILIGEFPGLAAYGKTLELGDIGVGVFFFLSGYILTYTYSAEFGRVTFSGWRTFMRKRFARVWPLQAATLVALIAADFAAQAIGRGAEAANIIDPRFGALPAQLTLTHAWIPWKPLETIPWNPPSWSISAEWSAYILAPFAIALLLRLGVALGGLVAAGLVTGQFLIWGVWGVDSGITRIFGLFFLGAFSYLALERTGFRIPYPDLLALAICIGLVPALDPTANTRWRFFVIVAAGLVILPFAQARGPLGRLLASRPMLFWGRVSFALYMTHWPLVRLFEHIVLRPRITTNSVVVRLGALGFMYGTMLAVAAATYLFVERPAERRLRRPWKVPRPRGAAKPAAEVPTPAAASSQAD